MAPKVKTPNFYLELGGIDFSSPKLKQRVTTIEVDQVSDGASSFKILLDDGDDAFATAKFGQIKEGDRCVIKLGYYETGLTQLIEGDVTGVKIERKEYARKIFVITGFDGLHLLTRGRFQRSFEEMKDSCLAQLIAGECGLGCDAEDSKIVHQYIVQNNVCNLVFLQERAKRIGFEVKVEGKKLVFKKPSRVETGVTLRWDGSKATNNTRILQRCDFNATTMNVPEEVVVRSYCPRTAKPIIESATKADLNGQMGGSDVAPDLAKDAAKGVGTRIQISDQPVASAEEAKALAVSILNQRTDDFLTGKGSCEGEPDVSCGRIITLLDVGSEMEGEYYVTNATHSLKVGSGSGGGYWTAFGIKRNARR
ncbi:MAG: hypothetical protein FWC40_01035 [Proteobacteria bacterium]|nr:hypothetical protein [Pseudomonadota bacterium]